nr:MAG TPA: Minor structural protein [Caudoviricetes sp.]
MIGATTSQILDLTLLNKGDMVYGTSTIKVEIGLKIGNTIEYIPMGIYNIDDIEKTDYTIKITAFDNMMKFERNFTTTLGDTLTLQQVASELTRITGVQFTGNLPAYPVKKLEGFSCREILGYVASLCGGNAIITRDGKFTIVIPKDNSYSIGTSNYFEYKREETKYKIGKISCQAGEEVLSKGSLGADSMELEFENPWVTNSILQDIYNKLNGFEYLGYSMKWQGDPSIDVGDIVTITDKKGVVRKHPILSQKFTYTGGLTSEISAKGENKNKNEFSGSGPSAKKVERVVMELALINKALIDVAYIGDLTAGNIKFDTASGTIMDLQTLLAKFVTGENGQYLNLTSSNVVIANAVIKDAMIDSLSLNKLKTGTINTNNINLASADGGLSIVGPTMQFKDKSNRVRLQLGQDTSGNFSFILRGTDGTTTLIDHTGIKEKAIADKLIKSNMVADGAIGEQQINYSSLVTGLNKDTNTQLIKASKVAIDLTGQSLEVSFNSLKSNVDNMEIGGRNLQGNADFNKPLSGTWRYDAQFMSINEEILCDGYKSVKVLRTNATTTSTRYLYTGGGVIPAKYGEEFTMSFMYYIPEDVEQEIDGTFQAGVWFYKDGNAGAGSTRKNLENEIVKGKWIKVVVSGKAKNVDTKSVAFVIGFDKNCEVYISKPKLERGNKATDFTVAPEDTDEKIEANTTAISIAQGKIEGLIKESSITKGDVTTLKDNYTSIKATVDGINTTVASHTSSIGTLNNNVSTIQSSITQLNNQITQKVEQTDIDTAVMEVDKKITATNNKVASIETNLNSITSRVSSTESTISTINGNVSSLATRMNSAEQKITPTSITTTISSSINNGISSISTTQFVMDKSGFTVKNGAIKVLNNAGQIMLQGDGNGNLSFSGRLQPYDYQIRLFGNECKIDGSAGAIRMQWNSTNYVSVENGAVRMYNSNSVGGTRYMSFAIDEQGHANMWGTQTRVKLLGNSSARPVVQSRNISDNAYGDFHGADFLNRSTIKDKTNVEIIEDLDFSKILLENNIFKYNLKTDVENLLKKFGLYEECNLDEVVDSSTDIRLGFILEELTEDARLLLCPGNMESISIYSMCSIMWKMCQQYQKRIEVLEEAVKLFRCFHGGVYEET